MSALSRLVRQWRVAWHRPRHWQLRPGTVDERVFREVVLDNEYRLPERFGPEDVVLDVGGHIGSFAYAVQRRGAGAVHCCEADAVNFGLLQRNLAPYRDRVVLRNVAIWRSDRSVPALYMENTGVAGNTGAGRVTGSATSRPVTVLSFDDLVRAASGGLQRRIRLLKLDCEGAEWPILFTSRLLKHIDALCGEYHLGDIPAASAVADLPTPSVDALRDLLDRHGFTVDIEPLPGKPLLGLFFARQRSAAGQAA